MLLSHFVYPIMLAELHHLLIRNLFSLLVLKLCLVLDATRQMCYQLKEKRVRQRLQMLTVEQFVAASLLKHNLSQWHKIWDGNNWLFLFREFPLNVQVNTYITK